MLASIGFMLIREVVGTALSDIYSAIFHFVNEAVCIIDAADEISLQVFFQGLGLPNTFHGPTPVDVFDEFIYAPDGFLVLRLPVQVIVPGFVRPYFLTHLMPLSDRAQSHFLH